MRGRDFGMPPRQPFRFKVQPRPLDMSVEACRERLASYERDPQCYRSVEQLEADRKVVAEAKERAK